MLHAKKREGVVCDVTAEASRINDRGGALFTALHGSIRRPEVILSTEEPRRRLSIKGRALGRPEVQTNI